MITHLTEDDLVLHYYDEMAGSEEATAAAHLAGCSQCHDRYRRLQRVARGRRRALAGPELPVSERTVWARLERICGPQA